MKTNSRREVEAWFYPATLALNALKLGEVDTVEGRVVVFDRATGEYERVDARLAGLVGCLRRLLPAVNFAPLVVLSEKLAAAVDLTEAEVDAGLRLFKALVKPVMRLPVARIREAAQQEMLLIICAGGWGVMVSREGLIAELRDLAAQMLDVATKMDYFGGLDGEVVQHAGELAGAAAVVETWVEGMAA